MKNARHIRLLLILALFMSIALLVCACKGGENSETETDDTAVVDSISEAGTDQNPAEKDGTEIFLTRFTDTGTAQYNTIEPVEGLAGHCIQHAGDLALFSSTEMADNGYALLTDMYLYSGKTNSILYSFSRTSFGDTSEYDPYTDVSIIGNNLYMTVEYHNGTFISTVYDAAGRELLTSEKEITITGDILTANHVKYLIGDGQLLPWSPIFAGLHMSADEPTTIKVSEQYLHQLTDRVISVYEENGSLKAIYEFPSFADGTAAFVLNNGNVLLQYCVEVKQIDGIKIQPNEYDFEQDDIKYKLYTILLDAETGKTVPVNFDYLVSQLTTHYSFNGNRQQVTDQVENIAFLFRIEDQKLNTSDKIWALMNNDGTIETLKKWFAGQEGNPWLVSDGVFAVNAKNGRRYLYDSSLSCIGDVTGSMIRKGYVITNQAVFDCFGHALVDLNADGYTFDSVTDSGVWLKKNLNGVQTYWLLSDGNLMIKADGITQILIYKGDDAYTIYDTERDCYLYTSADGNLLGQFREPMGTTVTLDSCVLYSSASGSRIYILHNGSGTPCIETQLTYKVEMTDDGTEIRTYEDGIRQTIQNGTRRYYAAESESEIGSDRWPVSELADQMMHAYEGVVWSTEKQVIHVWKSNETYINSLWDANKEYLMTTKGFTLNTKQNAEEDEQLFWSAENEAGFKINMYVEGYYLVIVCVNDQGSAD